MNGDETNPQFDRIQEIRLEAGEWRVRCSQALIEIGRTLPGRLTPANQTWIDNLENGYLNLVGIASAELPQELTYRILDGNWTEWANDRAIPRNDDPGVAGQQVFCHMQLIDIESALQERIENNLLESGTAHIQEIFDSGVLGREFFTAARDANTNFEYLVGLGELFRIYAQIRFDIAEFIDQLIIDLELRPPGR